MNKKNKLYSPSMKWKLNSFAGSLAVISGITLAPTTAYAACGICGPITLAVQTSTSAVTSSITLMTQQLKLAIQSATESMVGVHEKNIASQKELTQASVNSEAANKMHDATISAQEKFTADQSKSFMTCETIEISQKTTMESAKIEDSAKVYTAKRAIRAATAKNKNDVANQIVKVYENKYCTDIDVTQKRCTKAGEITLQGASYRADILLTPTAKNTYSKEEYEAAGEYITTVTDPIPETDVPIAFEKTQAGKAYRAAIMTHRAQMSVAHNSLEAIRATRSNSETTAATGHSGDLSMLGAMEKFTHDKFGNPNYTEELQVMNKNGLLKELAVQLAYKNWVNYQEYIANERIETILATQLSNQVNKRALTVLSNARSKFGS